MPELPDRPDDWPVNADGDPYPYSPIVDVIGEPVVGPTIAELVAANQAREKRVGAETRRTREHGAE